MSKKYHKAPLPFLGQKRNFVKLVRQLDFSGKTVVDLFGGSGILSQTIKQQNPTARVIYNDFDNYQSRLAQIEVTEGLRLKLIEATAHLKKATRVDESEKEKLLDIIRASGCTDWITISSWLLFSGKYAHNLDHLAYMGWYARVPGIPLTAEGYLSGVERIQSDFRKVLEQYYDQEDVIYIADPPYIMTNQMGYVAGKNDPFFRLKDAIDLTRAIYSKPVLYFSSPKSETEALFEVWQPETMHKTQLTTGIGDGNKAVDYLFYLNCQESFCKDIG